MSDTNSIVLFGVALFMLLVLSLVIQAWRTRRSPMGKVVGIVSSVRHNMKLCDNFRYDRSIGRFKTVAWDKHKEAVGFLPEGLRTELSGVFEEIAEINESIDAARKYGSDSYMSAIDVSKLKAPLASCKEKLQAWVYENMNNPKYLPKRRSLFRW